MIDRLDALSWREHHENRAHTFRMRERRLPGCTLAMLVLGGLLALYVVVIYRWTGGPLFIPGVVLMAGPVAIFTAAAIVGETLELRGASFRLDPERLVYGYNLKKPEHTYAIADIDAIVPGEYGGVRVRGREGETLAWFPTCAPNFVASKLQEALDDVRAPRTYRG